MFFAKFNLDSAKEFLADTGMALVSPPAAVVYSLIYLFFFMK